MKYSTIAITLFSGLALAQSSLPECAQPCIATAVKSATKCGADDQACQCLPENKAAIQGAATTCVLEACKEKAIEVLTAANAACMNLPPPAESSSAAPPAETSSMMESSMMESSMMETLSMEPTKTPSYGAPVETSSSAPAATTTPAVVTKPTTTNGTAVVSTSPKPTTSQFAGGAATVAVSFGSVFALGLAALAAL